MYNEKESIIELISRLSLATINVLSKDDNGIGTAVVVDAESINELHDIRKSIITENVRLRLRDMPNITLRNGSLLRTFMESDVKDFNFGELPKELASIITNEFNHVKDNIVPLVNQMADRINVKTVEYDSFNNNIKDKYDIRLYLEHPILKMLLETDLVGWDTMSVPDLSKMNFSIPTINDISTIREVIKTPSVIANEAIDSFLASRTETEWVNIYNDVFGSLREGNPVLSDILENRAKGMDAAIFTYLVVRSIDKMFSTIEGDAALFKSSMETLSNFCKYAIAYGDTVVKNSTNLGKIILFKDDSHILINHALLGDLDIDGVIAAAIDGETMLINIAPNIDKYKEDYVKANELIYMEKELSYGNMIKAAIMDEVDTTIPDLYPEYNDNNYRLNKATYVYDINDLNVLCRTKSIVSSILTDLPSIAKTNSKFILDRMSHYIGALEKDIEDYSSVAEYVALELVSRYLVNTHVVKSEAPIEE